MRLVRIATLVSGLLLLSASLVLAATESRADYRTDLAHRLKLRRLGRAHASNEYFERSASIVRQLSENPAFRSYYDRSGRPPDARPGRGDRRGQSSAGIP